MQSTATSALVTDAGFCVALNDHNQLITQPCDQTARQQFSWDAGALQLDQRCLVAKGVSELTMAECQDESRQWQWQEDRLFNSKADRCLDVAGRRHKPGTRCGWPTVSVGPIRASHGRTRAACSTS